MRSGYRRYDGQAVIDLVRIATLAGAGVPLARIGELLRPTRPSSRRPSPSWTPSSQARIAELQQRRADLAQLPSAERLCVPDEVAELLDLERSIGVSERTIGWNATAGSCWPRRTRRCWTEVYAWKERTTPTRSSRSSW